MANFDKELDARGLNCPLPILRTKKFLQEMGAGQTPDHRDRSGFGERFPGIRQADRERPAGVGRGGWRVHLPDQEEGLSLCRGLVPRHRHRHHLITTN